MDHLTDHFSWEEVVHTLHRDVDNTLPVSLQANARKVAMGLEKVRVVLGNKPISVSSWYRSQELNKRVGGSKNSQHMQAAAVDFICPAFGNPLKIAKQLISGMNPNLVRWDQLILEHNWIHIGFQCDPTKAPKVQVLTWLGGSDYVVGLTDKKGNPV